MTVYGYKTRRPDENYFATIVASDGSQYFTHLRTNLGTKVAYAMIAKHYAGDKIASFRHGETITSYDRQALDQGSDGVLRTNIWAGYSSHGESYSTAG